MRMARHGAEIRVIKAQSIGWLPVGDNGYLHVLDQDALVRGLVGVPDASMVRCRCVGGG